MILVEIVKLIIHIDRSRNVSLDFVEVNGAINRRTLNLVMAVLIVSLGQLNDFVAHDLKDNSDGQEDNAENTESQHGTHGCWHWSPSWQSLLLELRLLQLLNFLTDSLLLLG